MDGYAATYISYTMKYGNQVNTMTSTNIKMLMIVNLILSFGFNIRAEKWESVDVATNEIRVVEYCETEVFHAECADGEVIVMRKANYGRMKFGRCVDRDYGYVGCATDVLKITDKWCSGRQACDIPVPNSAFRSTQPCPKDLKPYFEAEYNCVPVESGKNTACEEGSPIVLTGMAGYLAKVVAEKTGLGSAKCPWMVEAKHGQTVSITMLDFSLSDWSNTNLVSVGEGGICRVAAVIREISDPRGITVCGGDGRERNVFTSVSHAVEIRMLGQQTASEEGGYYLLKYEVHGCPDPEPPPNGWLKRKGNEAEIGCETTMQKWTIECKGKKWDGPVGNCSTATPVTGGALGEVVLGSLLMPFGKSQVSLIIITAIAVAIGIIILSIGLICLRWRINKRQNNRASGKQTTNTVGNTYNGKSHRTPNAVGSQDSFPPPPPPEVDHEMLINCETENEYAYIADIPPPPPVAAGSVSPSGSEIGDNEEVTIPQRVFHDFYPTTPYEQSPLPSPYHSRHTSIASSMTPKLLAHECALAAATSDYGHHGNNGLHGKHPNPSPGPGFRTRKSSNRSRLGSDGNSETPTYFELEPEDEAFSFVMHMPSVPMGHEGPAANAPYTPPPPPTPPIVPQVFFSKASPLHNSNNNHVHLPQKPQNNHNHNYPPSQQSSKRIGPKTAPKPKRPGNNHVPSNRTSMPIEFSNGNVNSDDGGRGQNTL